MLPKTQNANTWRKGRRSTLKRPASLKFYHQDSTLTMAGESRRKHDADYVVGLEAQIELLREEVAGLKSVGHQSATGADLTYDAREIAGATTNTSLPNGDSENLLARTEESSNSHSQSTAMSDISSLMWQLTIGNDGETTLIGPSGNFCFPVSQRQQQTREKPPGMITCIDADPPLPQPWNSQFATLENVQRLVDVFYQLINPIQQFFGEDTAASIVSSTSPSMVFLRCAVLAASALFSDDQDSTALGSDAAWYIEAEVMGICRRYPCAETVQGLAIMCWRELGLDNENMAWMYNCKSRSLRNIHPYERPDPLSAMTCSLALHLGLTVSSLKNLSEVPEVSEKNSSAPLAAKSTSLRLRALWATVFLDRSVGLS